MLVLKPQRTQITAPLSIGLLHEGQFLAVSIGEWVLHAALTQIERWRDAGLSLPVSVNIGAYQLQRPDFVERVRSILAAHGGAMHTGQLMLEILETSALDDLSRISTIIEECRTLGVGFSLDDFGTGYSSLTYLKRLPVTKLKIDQSFVRDMLDDPDDLAILQGILGLATAFRRQVIAEGVEMVEHGELLLQLGCELGQGYCIARPMPAAELPGWVATWRPDAAWRKRMAAHRDDLPLLCARPEHNAWSAELKKYLAGERAGAPTLEHHRCRFGQWLSGDGQVRHGDLPEFQLVVHLHRQVHALASDLCAGHASAATHDAADAAGVAGLADFDRALEALVDAMKRLLE